MKVKNPLENTEKTLLEASAAARELLELLTSSASKMRDGRSAQVELASARAICSEICNDLSAIKET